MTVESIKKARLTTSGEERKFESEYVNSSVNNRFGIVLQVH